MLGQSDGDEEEECDELHGLILARIVARKYDFLKNREILVVTNEVTATAGR